MRKIGELKGKPIIEGNPNEIKKNQIHYKESDGSITLSERKEDNTLSSVTSGSGSGEGVKEYYYKIKPYLEDYEALPTALNLFIPGCSYIIQVGDKTVDLNNYCGFAISNGAVNGNLIAVKFKDIVTIGMHPEGGAELILPKGNLYNRTEYFFRLIGKNAEEAVSLIRLYTQEITKEEYESMITYKPE